MAVDGMTNHPPSLTSLWDGDASGHPWGYPDDGSSDAAGPLLLQRFLLRRALFDDAADGDGEGEYEYEDFTTRQQIWLNVIQRIAGFVSLVGAMYMFARAWPRRHCAFDGIMLGLSIHTILWSICHLWGVAALPVDSDVFGADGSHLTCTIQGFLLQITTTIPFYYMFLSIYSWVVIVQSNFDPAQYEWIVKYIHIGVHVIPIASAIILLKMEAFNVHGHMCWIASVPAGCGTASGIECTHGPKNPNRVLFFSAGIPSFLFLTFPVIAMVGLVWVVHLRSQSGIIPPVITSSMVAKQSILYLGFLYWVYLPLVLYCSSWANFKSFWAAIWVTTFSVSLGLWFAIVYHYFSSSGKEPSAFSCDDLGCGECGTEHAGNGSAHHATERCSEPWETAEGRTSSSHPEDDEVEVDRNHDSIISEDDTVLNDTGDRSCVLKDTPDRSEKGITRNHSNHSRNSNRNYRSRDGSGKSLRSRSGRGLSASGKTGSRWTLNESGHGSRERFSFNIFDGTASSGGKFAAFVFEGDSDDEESDMAETRKWSGCQAIISDH